MVREIVRTYEFSSRDVREALIRWLKAADMQAPQYVGDTNDTTWTVAPDGGQTVRWTVRDDVEVPSR